MNSRVITTSPSMRRRCTKSSSPTNVNRARECTRSDIAKRLIDYGFHPMTIYFPLIVQGAMLIEPTESVGHQELDQFVAAMQVNRA